ncbi:metallophosphoesterase [Roseobacter sinensis]|uniref:Metallophosphoesterase n=1 Tax=Roseobacter sinensis TaxID=2931391 RepID=A0ABT3BK58_9RHOB|nr:metallophosphoesterase [Roseobacter sp. WL0113]MCV3273951.1 metallophosphoesterase [Roseobacter sp. WL0113]
MSLPVPYHFIERQMQRVGLRPVARQEGFAPLRPDAPFWVVGDIHGRRDLLDQMLTRLIMDPVVFVGDLIDRGPDSRAVLERVFDLSSRDDQKVHVIKGNHEQLLLDFLHDPEGVGPAWMRSGGLQTLESFGISLSTGVQSEAAYRDARDALDQAMGPAMVTWLQSLPFIWSSGNVHVVHAGADPARPMDAQDPNHLCWGHRDFEHTMRSDGQWVVHGHVIVREATRAQGRIAIDTGAYATGILTAAHVSAGALDFVTTGAPVRDQ